MCQNLNFYFPQKKMSDSDKEGLVEITPKLAKRHLQKKNVMAGKNLSYKTEVESVQLGKLRYC